MWIVRRVIGLEVVRDAVDDLDTRFGRFGEIMTGQGLESCSSQGGAGTISL